MRLKIFTSSDIPKDRIENHDRLECFSLKRAFFLDSVTSGKWSSYLHALKLHVPRLYTDRVCICH